MRSRNVVANGLVTLALVSALVLGCSKNSSGPGNPITNPEFNYMTSQVSASVDSLVALSGLGLDMTVASNADVLTDIAFGPMPVDSLSMVNFWNIFILTNSGTGVSNHWIDSVQFLRDGAARQNPLGANEMQYVRHWTSVATDTTSTYRNLESRTLINADNTSNANALLSGSFSLGILDVDKSGASVVVRDLTINGTISSFSVSRLNGWSGGCPTDGQINMTATLSVKQGSAAPVVSTWDVDVTFGNGRTMVNVTQNGASYSYRLNTCRQ